jgi:tRNA (guanosine-2'-O-)-methyltransferase
MPVKNTDSYLPYRTTYNPDLMDFILTMITKERQEILKKTIEQRTKYCCFVAEKLLDDHNIHAVVRTSECLGFQDFYNIPFDGALKKNRTITRGAFNWTHIYNYPEDNGSIDCIQDLKSKGYRVFASTLYNENIFTPETVPIDKPLAIVLGNEHMGVSDEVIANADGFIQIPMYGFTESYNVSVAAALMGYHINERVRSRQNEIYLNALEKRDLFYEWLWFSIKNPDKVYEYWKREIRDIKKM